MARANNNINTFDYEQIQKIIKNDERMLHYLKCEMILDQQNEHLKHQRETYKNCLETFDVIKTVITDKTAPTPKPDLSSKTAQEHKPKPKPDRNFDFDF